MKKAITGIGLACSLVSYQAMAEGLYLQLFLDNAPLRGVALSLDGIPLGSTDGFGGRARAADSHQQRSVSRA